MSAAPEEFRLSGEDKFALQIADSVARKFLYTGNLSPRQIVGIGNALFAFDRLPLATPGVCCEFGVTYRAGDKNFSEVRYISFRITEESFSISRGGSVYRASVGSDSFSEPDWRIGVGGYADRHGDLCNLESTVREFLNLGADMSVDDESQIDYSEY